MADQQQETLNLLENFLNQPAWAYVHDHEALLMGVYEPDGEENNEDNTEEESSEESESINTQNTALICPFEIKWAAIEKLVNEMEEKFVRMPGPNLVKRSITQLPLVQMCLDGANAPMVPCISRASW